MEIGDERTDVARGVGALGVFVRFLAVFDVFFHAEREFEVLPFVDGVHGAVVRDADVFVREAEDAERGVVGEAIDAVAGGVHQHGRGTIDDVARRHLAVARLQEVFEHDRRADGGDAAVDGKYRADGDVYVDIG